MKIDKGFVRRDRSYVSVRLIQAGKVWRCMLDIQGMSRADAVGLLRGSIADLEAEVEGEAIADQVRRRRGERTDRREAA